MSKLQKNARKATRPANRKKALKGIEKLIKQLEKMRVTLERSGAKWAIVGALMSLVWLWWQLIPAPPVNQLLAPMLGRF